MRPSETKVSGQGNADARYDFRSMLRQHNLSLTPIGIGVMQMNITSLCNQSCSHCRVDASPKRMEQMDRQTAERCLSILAGCPSIETLDITGGAPELNRHFESIVVEAHRLGRRVVVRHNLTVTFDGHPQTGESKTYLPEFFAANRVDVMASLPHYEEQLVREQRGPAVFEKSIKGLQGLNAVGYGIEGSGLTLNLVHNPIGAALPGDQRSLETEFKQRLRSKYSVEFNSLYTMTNVPVKRFKQWLEGSGAYDGYMNLLVGAFNPAVASGVMCRSAISVAYDGRLYDCDINQALDMQIAAEQPMTVYNFDPDAVMKREIQFGPHCFACTAAAGSG
jgi:radical SAM/Cys-rich protein